MDWIGLESGRTISAHVRCTSRLDGRSAAAVDARAPPFTRRSGLWRWRSGPSRTLLVRLASRPRLVVCVRHAGFHQRVWRLVPAGALLVLGVLSGRRRLRCAERHSNGAGPLCHWRVVVAWGGGVGLAGLSPQAVLGLRTLHLQFGPSL